jgi:hypothetical protein
VKISPNWSKDSFFEHYDIETENILYYWIPEIIKTLENFYYNHGEKKLKPAIDAFIAEQKRIEAIPELEQWAHDEMLEEAWSKEKGFLAKCKAYADFGPAIGMTPYCK